MVRKTVRVLSYTTTQENQRLRSGQQRCTVVQQRQVIIFHNKVSSLIYYRDRIRFSERFPVPICLDKQRPTVFSYKITKLPNAKALQSWHAHNGC
ncbi:hypothetical protein TNCV_1062201 [Trichonephila clavipes]|nr:hypothetical protein TNCV_1062201 [Trichonephila clavipes]